MEGDRTGIIESREEWNVPAQLGGVIWNLKEVSRTFQPSH
jgi:hypothetical protein